MAVGSDGFEDTGKKKNANKKLKVAQKKIGEVAPSSPLPSPSVESQYYKNLKAHIEANKGDFNQSDLNLSKDVDSWIGDDANNLSIKEERSQLILIAQQKGYDNMVAVLRAIDNYYSGPDAGKKDVLQATLGSLAAHPIPKAPSLNSPPPIVIPLATVATPSKYFTDNPGLIAVIGKGFKDITSSPVNFNADFPVPKDSFEYDMAALVGLDKRFNALLKGLKDKGGLTTDQIHEIQDQYEWLANEDEKQEYYDFLKGLMFKNNPILYQNIFNSLLFNGGPETIKAENEHSLNPQNLATYAKLLSTVDPLWKAAFLDKYYNEIIKTQKILAATLTSLSDDQIKTFMAKNKSQQDLILQNIKASGDTAQMARLEKLGFKETPQSAVATSKKASATKLPTPTPKETAGYKYQKSQLDTMPDWSAREINDNVVANIDSWINDKEYNLATQSERAKLIQLAQSKGHANRLAVFKAIDQFHSSSQPNKVQILKTELMRLQARVQTKEEAAAKATPKPPTAPSTTKKETAGYKNLKSQLDSMPDWSAREINDNVIANIDSWINDKEHNLATQSERAKLIQLAQSKGHANRLAVLKAIDQFHSSSQPNKVQILKTELMRLQAVVQTKEEATAKAASKSVTPPAPKKASAIPQSPLKLKADPIGTRPPQATSPQSQLAPELDDVQHRIEAEQRNGSTTIKAIGSAKTLQFDQRSKKQTTRNETATRGPIVLKSSSEMTPLPRETHQQNANPNLDKFANTAAMNFQEIRKDIPIKTEKAGDVVQISPPPWQIKGIANGGLEVCLPINDQRAAQDAITSTIMTANRMGNPLTIDLPNDPELAKFAKEYAERIQCKYELSPETEKALGISKNDNDSTVEPEDDGPDDSRAKKKQRRG